jgi:hypothetical protein
MSARVSFTDLLKKGAEKDKQKVLGNPSHEAKRKSQATPPTPPTKPTSATARTTPTPTTEQPISPERDFAKVANSIVREAVAQGLFIGKSKQIYDFLYLQTRGAMQPKRSARITKSKLMRGADIGSERTLLKNLSHLKAVGLIKIREFNGQHGGNEYEVFLPEEAHPTPPTPLTADQSHYSPQKVGTLPPVESNVSGVGQVIDNTDIYGDAKTSFKDSNRNDDERTHVNNEAFTLMTQKLNTAVKKITGKSASKHEAEKWGNLADLLILELEIAASRSTGVSSVPAFLTEIIRRKFFTTRNQTVSSKKTAKKIDTVGKSENLSYEIKPLNEKEREETLSQLQEFAGEDFLLDFKKWYLNDDWEWLMKNLIK